jgi:hypothetical protein
MRWLKQFGADFIGFTFGGSTKLFGVPSFLRKEPEFKMEAVPPATHYALSLISALAAKGVTHITFRRSEPLPVLSLADLGAHDTQPLAPVSYDELANVLKVHAGLNPVPFPTPTTGRPNSSYGFAQPKRLEVEWSATFHDGAAPEFTLELSAKPWGSQ